MNAPTKKEPRSEAPLPTTIAAEGAPRQLNIMQNPSEVIAQGTEMANQLKDVITRANLITKIGNGEHLQFEAWQTLGAFMGVTPKTEAVEVLKDEKDKAFAARAHVSLVDRNGNNVGGAEALCSRAERNWKSKDWFQLESMAQTRAAAKALRMKFAWIVVLAGYNPTPAEEMVFEATARPAVQTYKATHHAPMVKRNEKIENIDCPDCIRAGDHPVGKLRVAKRGQKKDGTPYTMVGCANYPKCKFRSFDGHHGLQIQSDSAKKTWAGLAMNDEHVPNEEVYPEMATQDEAINVEALPL